MGEVGELLELLHGARRRYRTVRGALRQRSSLRLTQEAHERWQAQLRAAGHAVGTSYAMLVATGDGPPAELPDRQELVVRFWSDPPSRLREETRMLSPHPSEHVVVRDGERWWTYSPEWGAVSNVGAGAEAERTSPGGGDRRRGGTLRPRPGAARGRGKASPQRGGRGVARTRSAGRPSTSRSSPGSSSSTGIHAAGSSSCPHSERGVILGATALLDGEELSASPVYLIPELPEGRWELHVVYVPPSERPPMREAVHLAYHRADATHHLIVTQSPAVGGPTQAVEYKPAVEPETVERDDLSFAVHRPPRRQGMPLTVSFERGGTALRLSSPTLDEAVLLDLAASMERFGEDGSADQRAR